MTTVKIKPLPPLLITLGSLHSTHEKPFITPRDNTQVSLSYQDANDLPMLQQMAHNLAKLDQLDDDNDDFKIP
ncbi:hypothetical protein FRC08_002074, partial [Ceratobasidium sp. 394]